MFNIFKNKKKKYIPVKYWDFSYANKFFKQYANYIELFELTMFHDNDVYERFIENGKVVKVIGGSYQLYYGNIDGVICTSTDIPCIHVLYKGGNEEWIACYIEVFKGKVISSFGDSHRKLIK